MADDSLHRQFQNSLHRGMRVGPSAHWEACIVTSYVNGYAPGWRNSVVIPQGWVLPPEKATRSAEEMLCVHETSDIAVEAGCRLAKGLTPITHEVIRNGQQQIHFHL